MNKIILEDGHYHLLGFRQRCMASTKPNYADVFMYKSIFKGKPLLNKDKIIELIGDTPPRQETWLNGTRTQPAWPVMIETVQFNCVWYDWEEPNWKTIPKLEIINDQEAYMIIKRLIKPKEIKEVTEDLVKSEKRYKAGTNDLDRIRSGVYIEQLNPKWNPKF